MSDVEKILDLAQRRVGHLLDVAELGIDADNFSVFRRIVLKEFGRNGFAADIERLLGTSAAGTERNGKGRNDDGEKGGAP